MATESKKRNSRLLIIVGVVIAVVAFGLSYYVSQRGPSSTPGVSSAPTVAVVVAKSDITQGTQITGDLVTVEQLPVTQVPDHSYASPSQVVNQYASVTISQNQPITTGVLVATQAASTSSALTTQPLDIHAGNVALAIPASVKEYAGSATSQGSGDLVSVGYWIQPEDRIDILIGGKNGVQYAFQDIRVLKVGTYAGAPSSSSGSIAPTVYIVEVSRTEAAQLTYLLSVASDELKYVLRSQKDAGAGNQSNVTITPQLFAQLFPVH